MLVIGEKEVNEKKVAVRRQGKGDTGAVEVEEFINTVSVEIRNRVSA